MSHSVKLKLLENFDSNLALPRYETEEAAGADIRANLPVELRNSGMVIAPGARELVPTGLAMEIPRGFEVQVRPRSGLSLKTPLLVVNSPGTIDSDYRGEVNIILGNFGNEPFVIKHGERLAQLVLAPVIQASFETVQTLGETDRGEGGFGSTGRR
jgi:dUTP pyrophosphatase